jgi:hypothetical protein
MPYYRLHIQGTLPVEFEADAPLPRTPETLQAFFEDCAVNPYALDDLVLRLEPDPEGAALMEQAAARGRQIAARLSRDKGTA